MKTHKHKQKPKQSHSQFTYFDGLKDFRNILKRSESDIKTLIGDTKIVVAIKKKLSIGDTILKNKQLCSQQIELETQKCGASNCRQCPLVNTSKDIEVNKLKVRIQKNLNCKSRNVLYLWQCQLCEEDDSYFGRTIQKSHKRTNTHRSCFCNEKWESSAFLMQARSVHANQFDLKNLK